MLSHLVVAFKDVLEYLMKQKRFKYIEVLLALKKIDKTGQLALLTSTCIFIYILSFPADIRCTTLLKL